MARYAVYICNWCTRGQIVTTWHLDQPVNWCSAHNLEKDKTYHFCCEEHREAWTDSDCIPDILVKVDGDYVLLS